MRTSKILPAVDERNPHLKGQVGECIYDFIVEMIGSDLAPKITGMLIDLPVNQIKQYLSSYDALQMKVFEARDHLTQRMEQWVEQDIVIYNEWRSLYKHYFMIKSLFI